MAEPDSTGRANPIEREQLGGSQLYPLADRGLKTIGQAGCFLSITLQAVTRSPLSETRRIEHEATTREEVTPARIGVVVAEFAARFTADRFRASGGPVSRAEERSD